MKRPRTRVNTVTCPDCKVEMYSRARHDYRTCGCPFMAMVDGGFDYFRRGGKDLTRLVCRVRYVGYTRVEMYEDWNTTRDKLGTIKKETNNG